MAYTAKSSRFLPSASSETSHLGARPRPVHVSPEGLRYLTARLVPLPPDGTAARLGVRRRSPVAGLDHWPARTSVRSRNRACHCKRRSEPAAGDRHLVVTSAFAATCSCAD